MGGKKEMGSEGETAEGSEQASERGRERRSEASTVYCLWLKIALSTRGVNTLQIKSHTCSNKSDRQTDRQTDRQRQ